MSLRFVKPFIDSASSPLTEIYGLKTLDEVEDWLKNYCLHTTGFILETRNNACKMQALKAEAYIKENYADAEYVHGYGLQISGSQHKLFQPYF